MSKEFVQKIGLKIRIERQKQGLSQEKLAEYSNLNRNSLSAIERGESVMSIETLENIAKALKLDIRELFNFVI